MRNILWMIGRNSKVGKIDKWQLCQLATLPTAYRVDHRGAGLALDNRRGLWFRHGRDAGRRAYPIDCTLRQSVLPDYLAVGNDVDYVHVPLDKYSAQRVATKLNAILPTARLCHSIYEQTPGSHRIGAIARDYYRSPGPNKTTPNWAQTSTAAYREHSQAIQDEMKKRRISPGELVAGHKKDVGIAQRLHQQPRYIAFHGFYDGNGYPYEPCYENPSHRPQSSCRRDTAQLAHPQSDGRFFDYSQRVRLVHRWMEVNGKPRLVKKVLAKDDLSLLIGAEGKIDPARIPRE